MSVWLGAYNMLQKRYALEAFLRLSADTKANTLRIVPPIALQMAQMDKLGDLGLENVKFILCSGAALEKGVIETLQGKLGRAPIFQGYGYVSVSV
jgi:4-coumarate--CoA ligase